MYVCSVAWLLRACRFSLAEGSNLCSQIKLCGATTAAGTAAKCGDKLAVEAGFGWNSTAPLALHRNLFFCALANSNKMRPQKFKPKKRKSARVHTSVDAFLDRARTRTRCKLSFPTLPPLLRLEASRTICKPGVGGFPNPSAYCCFRACMLSLTVACDCAIKVQRALTGGIPLDPDARP